MSREDWLDDRKRIVACDGVEMGTVTASMASAAAGFDENRTPLQVWAEQTGRLPAPDLTQNLRVRWGLRLEGSMVDGINEDHPDWGVDKAEPFCLKRHPVLSWLGATPDVYATVPDKGSVLCQLKTAGFDQRHKFIENGQPKEPPLGYLIQAQVEMEVLNIDWDLIYTLVAGNQPVEWWVPRNREFMNSVLLPRLNDFSRRIATRTPPEMVKAADLGIIQALYQDVGPEILQLDEGLVEHDRAFADASRQMKEAEAKRDEAKAHIAKAMGFARTAVLPNGSVWTRKAIPRKEYTVKATTYIDMRRKPQKESE